MRILFGIKDDPSAEVLGPIGVRTIEPKERGGCGRMSECKPYETYKG